MIEPRSYLKRSKKRKTSDYIATAASIGILGLIIFASGISSPEYKIESLVIPTATKVTTVVMAAPPAQQTKTARLERDKVIDAMDKYLGGLLKGKGWVYYDAGKQQKVNPMLMAAISIHETGNGTSQMVRTLNNVGGITWSGKKSEPHQGRWRKYNDIDDGIYNMAYILKNFYINEGRGDIVSIGRKYCPLHDPESGNLAALNNHWIPKVTEYYNKISEEAKK